MKKTILTAIIISTLVAMAPATYAGIKKGETKKETNASEAGAAMNVKYLGQENEYLILQVVISTKDSKAGEFYITDANGIELYRNRVKDNKYALKFKVSPIEIPNIELVFSHSNGIIKKKYSLYRNVNIEAGIEEMFAK